MDAGFEQRVRLLFKEAYRRKVTIALAFLFISVVVAAVGATWPKSYSSSTTLLVEEKNIIDDDNNDRGRGDSGDKVRTVEQILDRRGVLEQVLRQGGWIDDDTSPMELEGQIEALQERMRVTNPAPNLVKITYRDSNAQRAYDTTNRLGEVVIDTLHGARTSQSRAAYDFISRQVQAYQEQMHQTQARLNALRERNPLARPGAEEQMAERIALLGERVETLEQEIREGRVTEQMLQRQLSGETEAAPGSGLDPHSARLAELREQLEELSSDYTDTYPDVVRLREQIAELEQRAERSQQQRGELTQEERDAYMAEQSRNNPVFQQLQQELYQTRTMIQRLDNRLQEQRRLLQQTREREQDVQELREEMQGLTRSYEVTSDIHQDLVHRRENARVAMQLDDDQQPFTLRVSEPAYMPHEPAGPRLVQFAAGGIAAGASVPLSLLFLFLLVDPRVRTGANLPESCSSRLLEVVPHVSTRRERIMDGLKLVITLFIVLLGIGGVAAILALRYLGQI